MRCAVVGMCVYVRAVCAFACVCVRACVRREVGVRACMCVCGVRACVRA